MVAERRDPELLKAVFRDVMHEELPGILDAYTERLGINPKEPIEFQKDMAFARGARKTVEAVKSKSILAIIAAAGTSIAAYLGFHSGS